MKNRLSLLFFLPLLFSCAGKNLDDYKPKYQDKWAKVDIYVQQTWNKFVGTNENLPNSFSYQTASNLQFYWDTYFTNKGLLIHKNFALAKNNVDNLLYEIERYGFVPNANAPWGTNRSQPPYCSMAVREYYEAVPEKNKAWLDSAYRTLKKEYHFWMDTSANAIDKNTTSIPGLCRYFHHASDKQLIELYNKVGIPRLGLAKDAADSVKIRIGSTYTAEATSGMDFTPRFESRCPDFIPVDLNTNLYLYEKNFTWMVNELKLTGEPDWENLAAIRKDLIIKYCWNEERGMFMDYDYINKRFSNIACAITFSPLYAGIATQKQAEKVVANLNLFESSAGIVNTEPKESKYYYQWGNVSVWPPIQILTIIGLKNYGYTANAKRIAMKYLDLVTANFENPNPTSCINDKGKKEQREPGHIYEKYTKDGIINDNEYGANIMMGWSSGAFTVSYNFIKSLN